MAYSFLALDAAPEESPWVSPAVGVHGAVGIT